MSKYGNRKTDYGGLTFDSKAESRRYQDLMMMERMGLIHDLRRQVPFTLIPAGRWSDGRKYGKTVYKADFTYIEDGNLIVEDVKGYRTEVYRLKRKLMKDRFNIEIREVRA